MKTQKKTPNPAPNNRILSEHFLKVKSKLLEYSKHFDIADHGDIKGYGREVLVQEFLTNHLPNNIEYLTGEIIDQNDNRSGQVDIILKANNLPRIPLLGNMHLAFSDTVIAAIEVKSTLTTQHLSYALHNFNKIKQLNRNITVKFEATAIDLDKIPCILFAFKGLGKDAIIKNINDYARTHKAPLDTFSPDMIVVLESDFYICKNDGWLFPIAQPVEAYFRHWEGLPHENLVGIYIYLFNVLQGFMNCDNQLNIAPYFEKNR